VISIKIAGDNNKNTKKAKWVRYNIYSLFILFELSLFYILLNSLLWISLIAFAFVVYCVNGVFLHHTLFSDIDEKREFELLFIQFTILLLFLISYIGIVILIIL
jgi:hypothetical protein